jgi:hypothetical protein
MHRDRNDGEEQEATRPEAPKETAIDNLRLTTAPVVKTGMLIRKPAHDVFEAFVNPESPRGSGSRRAAASSRPANRCNGSGRCTESRSR